jgi:hypothetical protein
MPPPWGQPPARFAYWRRRSRRVSVAKTAVPDTFSVQRFTSRFDFRWTHQIPNIYLLDRKTASRRPSAERCSISGNITENWAKRKLCGSRRKTWRRRLGYGWLPWVARRLRTSAGCFNGSRHRHPQNHRSGHLVAAFPDGWHGRLQIGCAAGDVAMGRVKELTFYRRYL